MLQQHIVLFQFHFLFLQQQSFLFQRWKQGEGKGEGKGKAVVDIDPGPDVAPPCASEAESVIVTSGPKRRRHLFGATMWGTFRITPIRNADGAVVHQQIACYHPLHKACTKQRSTKSGNILERRLKFFAVCGVPCASTAAHRSQWDSIMQLRDDEVPTDEQLDALLPQVDQVAKASSSSGVTASGPSGSGAAGSSEGCSGGSVPAV